MSTALPPRLQAIIDEFTDCDRTERLDLLLEYANGLPPLPERFADQELERVHECQTPLFVQAEVDEAGAVRLFFAAPDEAPTSKGFAGIIQAGLDGCTVDEVLATPSEFAMGMGLAEVVSPLRMRSTGAILARIKRQLVERGDEAAS
ncbi:MAG: SufE family protein [Gaiellales bacterium]|jgi:cysteine desulfuration protein SufE